MNILVTGANGQLGSGILHVLNTGYSEIGEINKTYQSSKILGANKEVLDIASLDKVRKVFNECTPDVVINAAAFTHVDNCETNRDLAFKVNALGAKNIAMTCEEFRSKLIHLSTDYVFNGSSKTPYSEYDLPSPINVYGKTKYLGEVYVREFCTNYFILRTSWLYGYTGKNFVKTILKAATEKDHINVVDDQIGSPTNVQDLVYHILKIALTEDYGIYHCTGNGHCSWFEFACKIIEFSKSNCTVNPIKTEKLKRAAVRPSFSLLDNLMLRCTVKDEMRQWEDALEMFINNIDF
ncbi:dTDP-4-dehydrorhamnose reductase [Wukongibacter baidiensis]|uniref:dTDP-4-dehydrorhamnose reductase n=1 Tax=Wukongibacter baidiensis TaxID=1723361 RepID=UPI003D7F93EF